MSIRVTAESYAVLKAAVLAKDLRGMQALLTPVVGQRVAQLGKDPSVQPWIALAKAREAVGGTPHGPATEERVPRQSGGSTAETRPRRGANE